MDGVSPAELDRAERAALGRVLREQLEECRLAHRAAQQVSRRGDSLAPTE